MRFKLWFCAIAALCLVASVAISAPLTSTPSKETKPAGGGDPSKALLDCSGAVEAVLGSTYSDDTTLYPNNVSTYSCASYAENGGEVVYHFNVTTPTAFEVVMTPSGCDLDLFALSACDEALCIAYSAGTGQERVYADTPITGDFYFVVDGYSTANCAFTIAFNELVFTPIDFCQLGVMPLSCEDQLLQGDTSDGANVIADPSACTGWAANGFEDFYSFTLAPGGNFSATVTFPTLDASIYALDACVEPWTCLAGSDNGLEGDPETVSYTNTGATPMTVYLVVDTYKYSTSPDGGPYEMIFTCSGGVIANEAASWSNVKGLYK